MCIEQRNRGIGKVTWLTARGLTVVCASCYICSWAVEEQSNWQALHLSNGGTSDSTLSMFGHRQFNLDPRGHVLVVLSPQSSTPSNKWEPLHQVINGYAIFRFSTVNCCIRIWRPKLEIVSHLEMFMCQ